MRTWSRVGALAGAFVLLMATGAAAQAAKSKPVTVTGRVVDNICWLSMGQKGDGARRSPLACGAAVLLGDLVTPLHEGVALDRLAVTP